MKITALEVSGVRVYESFRRFEFSPGLNLFVGPNRSGKTSLADALAAALYGTDRSSKSPLAKAHLQSWSRNGGRGRGDFKTAVELETKGGRFRLERDLETGRARWLVAEGQAWRVQTEDAQGVSAAVQQVTGLDRGELFLATAYLRQGDLARITEETNLVRMGEILRGIVSGVPQAGVSDILNKLRAAQRDVKSEGVKGHRPANPRPYDRLMQERERVQATLDETKETSGLVLSLAERRAELEKGFPESEARLEEVRRLLERWKQKSRLENEAAEAEAEAAALGRRLRRLGEIREELGRVREDLGGIPDPEGLVRVVSQDLPALRAERDTGARRSAELRAEIARLEDEAKGLSEEGARLEAFGVQARTIEEKLPVWEGAARRRAAAPAQKVRPTPAEVPSWGMIGLAFALFLVVMGAPFLYQAVTGTLPPYLFVLFGLAFPVLVWAMALLNRRLLRNVRLGGPPPGAEDLSSVDAEPEEDAAAGMAALFEALGVESGEQARAGLRRHRDVLSGQKTSAELRQRAERDLSEAETTLEAANAKLQDILTRYDAADEEALLRAHDRARDLLRRREDALAREKELLADGTEEAVAARLDEVDRRRRDLNREAQEARLDVFHPTAAEVEAWRREEDGLKEKVEADRMEIVRLRARLEEKMGEGFLSVETLEERLKEIDERLHDLDLLHRAYGVAMETLEEAAQELEESYLPRLQGTVQDHFQSVVGRDFGLDLTSRWPEVAVALPDKPDVEPRNLSRGTADQLYLALRVACLELLGGEEPLPLILDDPFVHYDDASRQRALAWLQRTASRTQVVFLAARDEYADWAERIAGEDEIRVTRLGSS